MQMKQLIGTTILLAVFYTAAYAAVSFVTEPQDVAVKVGETAVIYCEIRDLDAGTAVFWMNRTMVIAHNHDSFRKGIEVQGDDNVFNLQINSVSLWDEGNYGCQIPAASALQTNTLTVHAPPTVEIFPAREHFEIDENGYLNMICTGKGKPAPVVTWFKEDKAISQQEDLQILQIQRKDAGKYKCVAENSIDIVASKPIDISVIFPPTVKVPSDSLHTGPGDSVRLQCIFDSHPPVAVEWYHNDSTVEPDQTSIVIEKSIEGTQQTWSLTFTKVRDTDLGMYQCSGTNKKGVAFAAIMLTANPEDLKIIGGSHGRKGEHYTLKWSVTSKPKLTNFDIVMKQLTNDTEENWRNFSIPAKLNQRLPVDQHEHTFMSLDNNSSYAVRLRAHNGYGYSEWSEVYVFHTSHDLVSGARRSCLVVAAFFLPVIQLLACV